MTDLAPELVDAPQLFRFVASRDERVSFVHLDPAVAEALRGLDEQWSALENSEREALKDVWKAQQEERGVSVEERFDLSEHGQRLPPRWRAALSEVIQRERAGVEVGDPELARLVRALAVRDAPKAVERPLPAALRAVVGSAVGANSMFVVIGLAMIATCRDQLGARRIARLVRHAEPPERQYAERARSAGFSAEGDWVVRVQELMLALADHSEREFLRRMGIYGVALASASDLDSSMLQRLSAEFPPELIALLDSYADAIRRSSRRHLTHQAASLVACVVDAAEHDGATHDR
jgi:hypothetical protein